MNVSVQARELTRLQIYDLWNAGMSSGDIAKEFDMTRSAVIGVIHRAPEGTIFRTRANTPASKPVKPPAAEKPFKAKAEAARRPGHTAPVVPKAKPVPPLPDRPEFSGLIVDAPTGFERPFWDSPSFTCRAVVGTGDDGLPLYCCAPKSEARANWYCDFHAQGLFTKPTSKTVKPAFDPTIRRT